MAAASTTSLLAQLQQDAIAQGQFQPDSKAANAPSIVLASRHTGWQGPSGHEVSSRNYIAFGALAIFLHSIIATAYINRDQQPALEPRKHKVEIEFIKPVIEPPAEVKPPEPPPPPPPPKPRIMKQEPPVPAPKPALRTSLAEQDIDPDALTVQENTEAPRSSSPVTATAPEPPPPPVEEPVTEATGYASYLKNPPPDYPAFAQRQGWEGTVLLHVHVLASGKPDKVEIRQSSGRKMLDESAVSAVKNWTFVPSKRGSTPIDGWATVPIEFKLSK
jgi:protein TonB